MEFHLLILEAAENFEKIFDQLEEDNPIYLAYFDENEEASDDNESNGENGNGKEKPKKKNNIRSPDFIDWEKASDFVKFLKVFYNITLKISDTLHVTFNQVFMKLS